MQSKNIENYIEFLLSAALQKCGNIYDAEDLTQETMLAALSYMSQEKNIQDIKAWLIVVMNRKFNDMLRKKYKQATVSIGDDFDSIDEGTSIYQNDEEDEAENVRKAVAYLAKIYREVIVRYYMNGQSIRQIAMELNIPEGTVKSRLHLGRDHVKKGISNMEKYSKQSYSPITLYLSHSGSPGLNGEPHKLVENDLIAQNILWLAYSKPTTIEEISLSIGIPAAYIEPIVQKLADGELMKKVGNKYYTDFMISTLEDEEKHIPAQKQLVHDNFGLFWNAIDEGLTKIRQQDFYNRCSFDAKNSLELYFAFNCLDYGTYWTFSEIFNAEQHFKERPNGGRWIAFGHVNLKEFNPMDHIELLSHSYSGERIARLEKYADSKLLEMHAYSADGFPCYTYYHSSEYTFFPENTFIDAEITKLLYIIHTGTDPETVGFNPEYLKAVPWLTKCKIFCEQNGKPAINIPVLDKEEAEVLWMICTVAKQAMIKDLKELLSEFFKGKKQDIPAHLDSVPLQKQYLYADNAILFATIREAIAKGKLYDGNYDDDSSGVNQPPCPMILITG
ncbi:MAG: RNA polymerase sigma factor [Clostridia bacterium]|nr:RNA polymerase sigma factor [Clostridia bacterium]